MRNSHKNNEDATENNKYKQRNGRMREEPVGGTSECHRDWRNAFCQKS